MEEEKQLNIKTGRKKINWRVKALLSILVTIIAIVAILFGVTYLYFEKKFENNTQKIAEASFKQADKDFKKCLEP